jgi:hypothetical protein
MSEPKVYAPLPIEQALGAVIGLAFMGGGLWGIWWYVFHPGVNLSASSAIFFPLAFLIALAVGAMFALGAYRIRTMLYPDRFVSVGMFGTRELSKNEITGYRTYYPARGRPVMQLYTTGEHATLRAPMYGTDAAYTDWFKGIPDLDKRDRDDMERDLQTRPDLGATPQARTATVATMTQIAHALNVAGWAILSWAWIYPKPYALAVAVSGLAPLAAVGVVFWSRGVMTINQNPRHDPRPSVAGLFFAGFGLLIRSVFDFSVLDWMVVLPLAAVVSLLLTGAAYRADPKALATPFTLFVLWMVGLGYGWGAAVEINALLDHAAPQEFQVAVTSKHVSYGRRHTAYDLILAPWGPNLAGDSVDVGSRMFSQVAVGDTVCVALHPGAFKVRWWKVRICGAPEVF